ncbi:2-dehydropantoate 2-reductase [Alteromonas halophila]|uniref:2-dehydropantoate 2-reductase n=1 Tax=Alteromonas halophila TaxID=516698 RepID=A0A918JEQ4_9ALTE|nr:2-dehydropantoate 2-reductase [Alteromonas halophila]GGW76539.1 2-dehydropantoate 2-reductase [Alteromonas halophila]
MHHLIFGSGLIGSYIGSVLRLNGSQVTLAARGRWQQRLSQSLTLTDYQNKREHISAPSLLQEGERITPDYLWLTVKCTAVEEASEDIAPLVGDNTVIICCQNGIGSHAPVEARFPDNQVLRAMVPFNVVWMEPSRLHRGSEGTLVIERQQDISDALINMLDHPMLPVTSNQDIEGVQWAKLQLNLGNGVNALAGTPVKQMLRQRAYRRIIADLMDELLAVCRAAARPIPKVARLPGPWLPAVLRLPDWLFTRVASQMLAIDPEVKTSMWWDLQENNSTEKAFLYGAVVDEGQRVGVRCPKNRAMLALLEEAEKACAEKGDYQSQDATTLEKKLHQCK